MLVNDGRDVVSEGDGLSQTESGSQQHGQAQEYPLHDIRVPRGRGLRPGDRKTIKLVSMVSQVTLTRILLLLFVITAAGVFGQTPMPVKAGDRAPALTFSKIVQNGTGLGGPQSLVGQITVLNFLPPVSINGDAVKRWNELVEQFADKPLNFVWIAKEKEETLGPFLETHPVRGWMVLDPQDASYKAYGFWGGGGVIIDAQGIIAGFTFMPPDARQIQAVLDGTAVAIKGEPTEEQMDAMFEGKLVRLEAEPERMPAPPTKPDLPPSEEVYITPSQTRGTIASSGPDHWMQRGFDLKSVIAMISMTDPTRVEIPDSADASADAKLDPKARWDFVLVPPQEEDTETMYRQVREGIEKYFHVTVTKELRSKDVYVMTALPGKTPPAKAEEFGGGTFFATSSNWKQVAIPEGTPKTRKAIEEALAKQMEAEEELATISSISAYSSDINQFREGLERGLKRPIVDETGLTGSYDFAVHGDVQTTEEFLGLLRDQVGLVLTPAQRTIEVVAVRPIQ